MSDHSQYDDSDLFNPETHHEQTDVPVSPLLWFIVAFIVFAVVTHLVIGFLYKGFAKMERNRMDPAATAVAIPADAAVPKNQPLLQPFPRVDGKGTPSDPHTDTPVTDLQKLRAAEKQVLDHYGWVDRQKGTVHIPIDEAKRLLAARLAAQSPAGTMPAATGTGAATTTAATAPASNTAPSGQTVPADTGVVPATGTGAHQ